MLSSNPNLENCQECLSQESQKGLATLRQHYLKFYPDFDINNITLQFVDLRWNNTCNLGCLYCNTDFSSTWVMRLNHQKKLSPTKAYQDDLLDWILQRVNHIKEIMLVGGEPMLMKQNHVLLAKLPSDCKISIITNLSYDLEKLPCWLDLLRYKSDCIVWNVSLENIGEQFEYSRSGGSWSQVQKNFDILLQHWPNNISLNMVYSVFSAFNLANTVEHFNRLGIKKINLFPVNGNPGIDISNFPYEIRKIAAEHLQSAKDLHYNSIFHEDRDLYPIQGADSIMQFLLDHQSNHALSLQEFDDSIKWYDKWSQKKFADLWPEVHAMIKSHLQ